MRPFLPPAVVLTFGFVAVSFSAILIRLAQSDAPSLAIAAGRMTLSGLLLLPVALLRRREELRSLRAADWRLAIGAGFFLSLHFAGWITSLEYTSVASSTVLVTTSPLWVGLASPFLLGERLPRTLKMGIGLAVVGSIIISLDPAGQIGQQSWLGNGLALLGALTAAAYFIIGRRLRTRLSTLGYTTIVYSAAALFLLAFVALSGQTILGYDSRTYFLFGLMALFPQLMGHSAYNWALGFLPAALVLISIISEPVGASLLAILFFQEWPGWPTIAGGLFVLAGIGVATVDYSGIGEQTNGGGQL